MLKIHFLNVGHGDCTFIEFPSDRLMMIDINNSKSLPEGDIDALAAAERLSYFDFRHRMLKAGRSWEEYYKSLLVDPVDYYRANFDGKSIFRYVQSHPDMDHMTGLHRFFWQEKIPLENFWDVAHSKNKNEEDFKSSPHTYADWLVYTCLRGGKGPDGEHKVIENLRRDTGSYWTDDGIEVLSPTQDLIDSCDKSERYNDCSYVLKISHAGRSVILPGDAEGPAWSSMLEELGDEALDCDVLKSAHHGRESGYHEGAVEAMLPDAVICSVGKKPETDASDEYAGWGAKVLSTRYHGTITVTISDDGDVWIKDHSGKMIFEIS